MRKVYYGHTDWGFFFFLIGEICISQVILLQYVVCFTAYMYDRIVFTANRPASSSFLFLILRLATYNTLWHFLKKKFSQQKKIFFSFFLFFFPSLAANAATLQLVTPVMCTCMVYVKCICLGCVYDVYNVCMHSPPRMFERPPYSDLTI